MLPRSKLLANFFGQFWVAGIGFAFVPLYLHYLGVEAYGIIGFMVTMQAWMSVLDFGMTPAVGREMAFVSAGKSTFVDGRRVLFTLETVSFIFVSLAVVSISLSSEWLTHTWLKLGSLDRREVQLTLVAMAFVIGMRFLIALYRGAILGLGDAQNFNLATAAFATLRASLAALSVAWIAPSILIFGAAQLISTLMEVSYFAWRTRILLPTAAEIKRFDWTILQRLWRFAAGVSIAAILGVALTQIDKLALSTLLPLSEFAAYFLAATLAGVILTVVGPVSTTVFPKLSGMTASNDPGIATVYHASSQLVAILVFPMVAVAVAFPEAILLWWTRNHDLARQAAPIFQALAVGTGLNALVQIPYMLQLSHGWTSLGAKANLVACVVLLPAVYVAVPALGVMGAAYVWGALNLAYVFVLLPVMHKRLLRSELRHWYVYDNLLPAAAAGAATMLMKFLLPVSIDGSALSMALIVCAGCAAVLSAAMMSKPARLWLGNLLRAKHGRQ